MNKKIIGGSVAIIVMLLVIIGLLTFLLVGQDGLFDNGQKNIKNNKIGIDKEAGELSKLSCPSDWTVYRQEAIGIEFCYPEDKWGTAGTEYLENITSLKNLAESYKKQNVYYKGYVELGFVRGRDNLFKQGSPILKIFNEEYSGEHYKNVRTHNLGYRDNILELKQSGDICKYKIEFNKKWAEKGSEKELYQDCKNGIKTDLVEQTDFYKTNNTGWKYQYYLNLFAYEKLQNGYFDNVLIKYNIGSTPQLKSRLSTRDEYFGVGKWRSDGREIMITKGMYNQDKEDFEKFVESIKIFKPVVEDLTKYKSNSAVGDKNVKLIEKYYWALTQGQLEDAYSLKNANESLTNFEEQYGNIHFARPYDFKKVGDNEYMFFVEYQDHNNPVKIYQIRMSIVDSKIKTNFVQMFITERVEYGNMVAYGSIRGDKSYVILEKGGKEIIVDQGEAKYDEKYTNINMVKSFQNVKFSPNGDYLKYAMMGYEWGSGYIYDIQNNKRVVESLMTTEIKFTPDGKYIYYCAGAGMGSEREGVVKAIPDFKEAFSVFGEAISPEKYSKNNEYLGVVCEYDKNENVVAFKLSDLEGKLPEKIVKYKLK